ncbi:MAG: 4Fe-4S dicluster domain-containing protein [Gammaproteobacteria bacterium]|nr:4Fe-4S dicluster domain-containing protein [Gammaproteobacteria bacterium]
MATHYSSSAPPVRLGRHSLQALIDALRGDGYTVIGPRLEDAAIVYAPLESADSLPEGWVDQQEGGHYRLLRGERPALFDYVVGPHSWKRYLYPPRQRLWQAHKQGKGWRVKEPLDNTAPYAFIGVRSCEIHAMRIQDRVFDNGAFADPAYIKRRQQAFIVAVNCAHPAATCFCTSMNSGPRAKEGFDLCMTELLDEQRHEFLVEAGSDKGAALLTRLPHRPCDENDLRQAEAVATAASQAMQREMAPDVAALLKRHPEHPRWQEVAQRCLSCANCTQVCPTCFCSTVEDVTDLSGQTAQRWRQWDSCFTLDFSYIHGGSIRRETRSRYRQWMTHKLSTWHDQFDTSGCVGCGRCITWCPVGIDITEEAKAIRDSEGGT